MAGLVKLLRVGVGLGTTGEGPNGVQILWHRQGLGKGAVLRARREGRVKGSRGNLKILDRY